MRIFIVTLLLFTTALASAQKQKVLYIDSVKLDGSFKEQVEKGMDKHHRKYSNSHKDFYTKNVSRDPIIQTEDSIIYDVKFVTSGMKLWNAKGKFTKSGDKIMIELSQFVLLKRSSRGGVDYINVAADDMEPSEGNRINLVFLKEAAEKFMKHFD